MADIVYTSALEDVSRGNIDFDTDTFYMMLVTSSYVPSKDGHQKRSDVTDEAVGAGYTSGGVQTLVTVTRVAGQVRVAFSEGVWTSATISAAGAVIYKRRGGAASADELVAYMDFGATVVSTAGTYRATPTSPLILQN